MPTTSAKQEDEDSAWPMNRPILDDGWRPPAGTKVISVDDHVMEEDGLWEKRLSRVDRDRAPRIWQDSTDSRWHLTVDGKSFDGPGLDSLIGEGCRGIWDVETRLADMDAEGIDVSMLFHSRAMSLVRMPDKAFFARCMDAYNEWLAEMCAARPDRLIGVGILPTIYAPEATADYIGKLKGWGLKALEIPSAPKNVPYNASAMEAMWEALAASGIPVMFHVGAYLEFMGAGAIGANLTKNLGPYRPLWSLLAFSGILERHPDLEVVFCEGGFGWVPWTLQDADRVYQMYETEMKPKLKELPSYYFRRQCYSAIMTDEIGLKQALEHDLTSNLLWSCDYPHGESVLGSSRRDVRTIFETLGDARAKEVVGGTAARLWNL